MPLDDKNSRRAAYAILILTAALLSGCGPKPQPLPSDVSAAAIIAALREQSASIKDVSGWAKVRVSGKGREMSSTASIRFLAPERFFVALHGPLGAELAEIGSDGDSITAYIPYYDGYIRTGKHENPLTLLLPEADIDIDRFVSLLSPSLPPADLLESYGISLEKKENRAELLLKKGNTEHCYTVSGPRMLLTEERFSMDGEDVWNVRRSDYREINGVFFPGNVHVEQKSGKMDLDFRNVTINSGLNAHDVTVNLPDEAQRLQIRRR